ncbi:exonuclease SbcCD subunit D [Raineyella sp. LH-20]|uniref:exonuclease SbcCD subunit D n=1 Tax=Raineyella sp. LH-20 TaxID=3081204 RepID=UPI0029545B54|nr:exonuclease SbcCD subunit D C-terminal domain-containing protein [Raineyella sp. LH-20]WOP19648.1 exonuclease SbcCD subunit D C-terminal domain-containing protein [Raineyella sp. LH-20]
MRILHTADWHLGRTLHGESLQTAHETFADHLVEVVEAEQIDAVLVAGDVYDRAIPPVESVALLGDTLARLTARTRVVITSGNHDSAVRLGFGAGMFQDRLSVRTRVAEVGRPVVVPAADGHAGLVVYPVPYLDPDGTRQELGGVERTHAAVVGAAMERIVEDRARRDPAVPVAVLAHEFVGTGETSDSERDIRVGGIDSVPSAVFRTADPAYVALGHLHRAQRTGDPERDPLMRYAGSPLAFSFSEAGQVKSSVIVDFDGSAPAVQTVPAPVPRRLVRVRGTLAELESSAWDADRDAWAEVMVTDPIRTADMMARARACFPHLLTFAHQPADRVSDGPSRITAAVDPLEVLTDFVADAGGRVATADEEQVLREAYEAVRTLAVA